MSRITRFCAVGAATFAIGGALALGTGAPATASSGDHHPGADGGAVFVQDDGLDGNTVIAYDRADDGALRQAGAYPTGGRGGQLDGSVVDHTASQGSLTLDPSHHLLYAVNAGSDSFTVFDVHGSRLHRRTVVSSRGDFPVSISARGRSVYVLNARDGGSIQGYDWIGGRLVRTSHRSLGLAAQAPEFTHTPGQVAITPDSRHLVVTTKAAANTIVVYNLDRFGRIDGAPVISDQAGRVPFAVAFGPRGQLVVATAGDNSLSRFWINRDGSLAAGATVTTGQKATCWVVADGRRFYASNAGSATLSGFVLARHGQLTGLGTTATDPGTVDAAVSSDHDFLYAQTGAAGMIDAFAIDARGGLTPLGSVTVPNAVGAEGIAAS